MSKRDKKEIEKWYKLGGLRYLKITDLRAFPKIQKFYLEAFEIATFDELANITSYLSSEVIEAVFGTEGYLYFKRLERGME